MKKKHKKSEIFDIMTVRHYFPYAIQYAIVEKSLCFPPPDNFEIASLEVIFPLKCSSPGLGGIVWGTARVIVVSDDLYLLSNDLYGLYPCAIIEIGCAMRYRTPDTQTKRPL